MAPSDKYSLNGGYMWIIYGCVIT